MKDKQNKGEMILIILLVMAVGLTIGLSVASRSVTDVKLSSQIEESSRAFSAAETGIEQALRVGLINVTPTGGVLPTMGASYNITANSYGGGTKQYNFNKITPQNQSQTVWLVPHTNAGPDLSGPFYTAGQIIICADKESPTAAEPALEMTLLFKDLSDSVNPYKVIRAGYDKNILRRSENKFFPIDPPAAGQECMQGDGKTAYFISTKISFNNPDFTVKPAAEDILIALRLRAVYANAQLAVNPQGESGATNLPEQGKSFTSTGQTNSGVTRRLNIVQSYDAPLDIFDYAIWSNTNLIK